MQAEFERILEKLGFTSTRATACSKIFTESSIDGVYSHGVNRFSTFISHIKQGYVKADAEPSLRQSAGAIEQWDGNLGPGPLNAVFATERAMQLAAQTGMGCVALSNTNHWMRGGTYGRLAAERGYVFIGFTNTIANMPAWGAKDKRLGNNPLILAVPNVNEPIVVDMAMSQYSFGALQQSAMKKEELTTAGGFDTQGNLTKNPSAILESRRVLPIGLWKGAGLALLLDILAAILSGGLSTKEISQNAAEYGLSQIFIAIDISRLNNHASIHSLIQSILDDYHASIPVDANARIIHPGQRVTETRERNMKHGIPVLKEVWEQVTSL